MTIKIVANDKGNPPGKLADAVLPWDIIDGGMKSSFFRAEFEKGLREEWTLPPKRQQENRKFLPLVT